MKVMVRKYVNIVLFVITLALATSCATIFSGQTQKVQVASYPSGARIYQDGKDLMAVTPAEVRLKRKKKTTITLQKDGYEDGIFQPQTKANIGGIVGNLVVGGIPGWLIDWGTGSMWKYDKTISYSFGQPIEEQKDPTITAGESTNRVTRDNPGGTDLERTIIRWFIDSEPRGARVFWRVISSVPAEVKNTNELYLGTTPYEETRSFNILGLTYQNSRDVTIEIRLQRAGYIDQVKRFNVRQAIDQQEISSFFEMVKK